jgi:hypothetical protein
MDNKTISPIFDDEKVQEMIENWDTVKCVKCGKKMSMLDADSVNHGEGFVHRAGHCPKYIVNG